MELLRGDAAVVAREVSRGLPNGSEQELQDSNKIGILNFGGQYCHMIARRLRDLGIESDVFPSDIELEKVRDYAGLIFSGGPQSVYGEGAPTIDESVLELGLPLLGICYGHQLLASLLGGKVSEGAGEFGQVTLDVKGDGLIFATTPEEQVVWMSHRDSVSELPPGLEVLAQTSQCNVAAFADFHRNFFGVQFHPEVSHSKFGRKILENFAQTICGVIPIHTVEDRLAPLLGRIRAEANNRKIFFLVSGGVDSTVAFALCGRALGPDRVIGMYIDTGLMRKGETDELRRMLGRANLAGRLLIRDESVRFTSALSGVTDPEEKRKIIGRIFIEVQAEVLKEMNLEKGDWLLGQGTIYPDTIESGGDGASTIKTHHNRCTEVLELLRAGRVIEPLAQFYKDEVRELGVALGLDRQLTSRWPFPGPGLAIRCICVPASSEERVESIKWSSAREGYRAVRVPIRSVGVQGDSRTYCDVVAIDGVYDYTKIEEIGTSLQKKRRGINRLILLLDSRGRPLESAYVLPAAMEPHRVEILREADHIVRRVMEAHGLLDRVWQFPVVLIPLSFGGGESVVLRPVESEDGMTAHFACLPKKTMQEISLSILSQLPGIDAVFFDMSDKPPATIEWE